MKIGVATLAVILSFSCVLGGVYAAQRYGAHRKGYFIPDYERVVLTPSSDYETVFLQTGLGKSAFDKLREAQTWDKISEIQDSFFQPPQGECTSLLGWFTREDRLEEAGAPLVDVQPGDILISLSTHSLGWNHGHAALVLENNYILEAAVLGQDSHIRYLSHWDTYSNYAVLRIKGITPEEGKQVAAYAAEKLLGVPYGFSAGFIGGKAAPDDAHYFTVHCAYLVWYAWEKFGYDTDSDGGRIVTPYDILQSDKVEIVQLYGLDPRDFLE